jgi:hypothetical protein
MPVFKFVAVAFAVAFEIFQRFSEVAEHLPLNYTRFF